MYISYGQVDEEEAIKRTNVYELMFKDQTLAK